MMNFNKRFFIFLLSCILINPAFAEDDKSQATKQVEKPDARLIPLNENGTVLLDKNGKRILLKTKVVLREGLLEMLCCIKNVKEHESILAVDAEAYIIHAGLLVIGAKPGNPVEYYPDYKPARGQRIDIYLQWKDKKGVLQREKAQNWVRRTVNRYYVEEFDSKPADLKIPRESKLTYEESVNELVWYGPMNEKQKSELLKYSKDKKYQEAIKKFYDESQTQLMKAHWLFAGSQLIKNPVEGQPPIYAAQSGDLICVANFPSSLLDLDIKSTSEGTENLLFEANTEKIPPLGTDVTIELIPAKVK